MKKLNKAFVFAAVALVATSGLFAAPKKAADNAANNGREMPPKIERPKKELPDEATVKAYHEAEVKALSQLLDAQVAAGIVSREWADARLAILRAVQADCKGRCILEHRTDIPFGGFGPGPKGMKGGKDCGPDGRRDPNFKDGPRGPRKQGFGHRGTPDNPDIHRIEEDDAE